MATGQTRSSLFGGAAIGISILALFPGRRVIVGRMACVAATWLLFNIARALSDEASLSVIGSGRVAELEARVLGSSPSDLLQDLRLSGAVGTLVDTAMVAVYLSFFLVPVVMAAVVAVDRPGHGRRTMVALGACLLLGIVGFLFFPTSPPWMADANGVLRLTPQVMSTMFGLELAGGSAPAAAAYSFEPNHLAAMPSIHVAATVLLTLVVASSWRRMAPLAWSHALAMTLAVVYVGEHHVLDAIGGWAVALAAWRLAGILVGTPGRRGSPARLAAIGQIPADLPTQERHDHHRERDQRGRRWRVGPNAGRLIGDGPIQRADGGDGQVRGQPQRRQQPDRGQPPLSPPAQQHDRPAPNEEPDECRP